MSAARRYRSSRSLSPPKAKSDPFQEHSTCNRCLQQASGEKKSSGNTRNKSQQVKGNQESQTKPREEGRYAGAGARRNSGSRSSYTSGDANGRCLRQANLLCTKHEKEKVKMQATIDKLQEAFCEKETKLQDARSQLVRERRMSEIMERQLKNARTLSEQLGRIIHEREQEIRTLKNALNRKQEGKSVTPDVQSSFKANPRQTTDKKKFRDEYHTSMRRSSSTSEHSECNSLSSSSVDKMLKEVHSLVEGLKIKDEAIKGLQEECTRRLDKIQTLQRSVKILQDQLSQTNQLHAEACAEKDSLISQLQHTLKETQDTVESLLSEKSKVAKEGESTIQELQDVIRQKDLTIKKTQSQLEEALEAKESEVNQLKCCLERQQKELEEKEKALEEVSEELYSTQMEAESLKIQLSQEKCSLNRMSEEINSLVDKLTKAVAEMETTKMEYQKKDERLKNTQVKIKDLYMNFFGDRSMAEKLHLLCGRKKEVQGRNVLSEDDIRLSTPGRRPKHHMLFGEKKCSNANGLSNTQIHKQQLAELQQQVTESQTVCGILQDQLKEVTDFLDQLLHIEISPKNLSALSLFRQYGKHLQAPVLSISKERIAPDGVSSNSQLDIESPNKGPSQQAPDTNQQSSVQKLEINKLSFADTRHSSCDNLSYYQQQGESTDQNFTSLRSLSAEDVQQSSYPTDPQIQTDDIWDQSEETGQQETASESDEIILLINDRDITSDGDSPQGPARPTLPSPPPFQHGLVVKENYGSTGSINTKEKGSFQNLERSASFGSFSGSVMMSYEHSGRTSNEDSSLMRSRCIRSIDMMDIIQVGHPGVGVGLSSDTDIWSEPDMRLSRQRMGIHISESEETTYSTSWNDSSEDSYRRRRYHVQGKGEDPKKNAKMLRQPTRKYASKQKRWLDRLKGYLEVFEEASYNLTDELNHLCQVRTDLLAVLSTSSASQRLENDEAILLDLSEYIRQNYVLQEKVEKMIHYNRQLIDASGKNVNCKPLRLGNSKDTTSINGNVNRTTCSGTTRRIPEPKFDIRQPPPPPPPFMSPPGTAETRIVENRRNRSDSNDASDMHTQLVGYHATLLSCQDMIKDLHAQLKERHCSELMNKHELNRTVYKYLEDIDACIDELCKKMENSGESLDRSSYDNLENHDPGSSSWNPTFTGTLMAKLKENEDRLLRFEELLNRKEQQLKLSGEDAVQLEVQLNSIKQSLYEIQVENLELKECLEYSESKQLEIEHSSNQMLRELQMTMQRLSELEEKFRCIDSVHIEEKEDEDDDDQMDGDESVYPINYEYRDEQQWVDEVDIVEDADDREGVNYSREWEEQNY